MPFLRPLLAQAVIGGMILVTVGGCGQNESREVVVDRHTFRVPGKHLVRGVIPWLPLNQSSGLRFVINPEAIPQEQMIVGIESTQITCQPKTPPIYDMLSSACIGAEDNSTEKFPVAFTPDKVYPEDDPTQWVYRVEDVGGDYRTVATCFALSEGEDGLCRSLNNYKDLVFSVGLRDRDIQRLPGIWEKVHEMLTSWEIEPRSS